MSRSIFYTFKNVSELHPNASYRLCKKVDRDRCNLAKKCLFRWCQSEEEERFGKFSWMKAPQKEIDKRIKKEAKVRAKLFKQCKPIEFIIRKKKSGV